MRTLKKSLCLVLAIVMVLGLGVFSVSATDFADDKDIQYKEAAEVLSAIGVIEGDETGFNPKKELTRAEGAVLIARLMGQSQNNGVSPFSDTADHDFWAGFAIQYCAANKIIEGTDDVKNTFEPDGKLTASAFAKMLLVALGYDPATENLNGPDWEIGVAKLVNVTNLKGGIDDWNQNNNVTREVAAQMCLKALEATMVYYEGGMNVVTSDGTQVRSGGTRKDMENTGKDYRTSKAAKNDEKMQLCEMYFDKLKKDDTVTGNDGLSPAGHVWKLNDKDVYNATSSPVYTFTKDTGASDISAALSSYYVLADGAAVATASNSQKWYINNTTKHAESGVVGTEAIVTFNGVPSTTTFAKTANSDATLKGYVSANPNSSTSGSGLAGAPAIGANAGKIYVVDTDTTIAGMINSLTGNGRKVELYATQSDYPNYIDKIVVTCYTAEEVNNVTVNGNKTTYSFSLSNSKIKYSDTPSDNTIVLAGGVNLSKGDWVTTTYEGTNSGSKRYVYPTDVFSGTQTSYNSGNELTIDGSTYKVATAVYKSAGQTLKASDDFNRNNTDADFYLDQYGFVVHSNAVSSGNYAFIIGASSNVSSSVDGTTPTITVRAVLSDGTVGTYQVATKKLGSSDVGTNGAYKAGGTYSVYSISTDIGYPFAVDDYVIKNTGIRVYNASAGTGKVRTSEDSSTAAKNGLMNSEYGFVYKYSLNSDNVMTLTPLANAYTAASFDVNKDYAGETYLDNSTLASATKGIKKGTLNYQVASSASAIGGSNWNTLNTASAGKSLLIASDTKYVVYNNDTKSATVYNGNSELPKTDDIIGIGYFAASNNSNNSGPSATAKYVFLRTGEGVSETVNTFAYVTNDYSTAEENGNTVTYYDAYREDGTKFSIKDKDDTINHVTGLYTYDTSDTVSKKVITKTDNASGRGSAISSTGVNNTDYVAGGTGGNSIVNNGMVLATNGNYYYTNTAVITYIGGGVDTFESGSEYYLVLEAANGSLTGNVTAVFVTANP